MDDNLKPCPSSSAASRDAVLFLPNRHSELTLPHTSAKQCSKCCAFCATTRNAGQRLCR